MNMMVFGKKSMQLCMGVSVLGILLLPAVASETTPPVPMQKPNMMETADIKSLTQENSYTFPSLSAKFANLFIANDSLNQSAIPNITATDAMNDNNRSLYRALLNAQDRSDWEEADRLSKNISDRRLMGYALYAKYMHPQYQSTFTELQTWMSHYADHTGAQEIYDLAVKKRTAQDQSLEKPTYGKLVSRVRDPDTYYPRYYVSNAQRTGAEQTSVRTLQRTIKKHIRKGDLVLALQSLKEEQKLDSVERDMLQTDIAAAFLYRGRIDSALTLASESAKRSGQYVPQASWITGLSLWRKAQYTKAAQHFENTAQSSYASGWLKSGGYFWAARSYDKANMPAERTAALKQASTQRKTFYGILATHQLGHKIPFHDGTPEYSAEHAAHIKSYDGGARALLLISIGQHARAENELMRLPYRKDKALRQSVLSYAMEHGLSGLALRLGAHVKGKNGYYDRAFYPVTQWKPQGGYRIDPALIHAIIRQESRFYKNAKSYSGASGLMQIMPKTAHYIAQKYGYGSALSKEKALNKSTLNLRIGQDYLDYLLTGKYVKNDMVSLLIAYNAGPGNLLKWRKKFIAYTNTTKETYDPLLFIETLPVQETRDYVEHVMANYWMYRTGYDVGDNAGLPTLHALANGNTPLYTHSKQKIAYQIAAR